MAWLRDRFDDLAARTRSRRVASGEIAGSSRPSSSDDWYERVRRAIEGSDPATLRAIARAAVEAVADRLPRDDDAITPVLQGLREDRVCDPARRRLLEQRVDALEMESLEAEEAADAGRMSRSEMLQIFERARAATALLMAVSDDAEQAASEAVYEAWIASQDDPAELQAALSRLLTVDP